MENLHLGISEQISALSTKLEALSYEILGDRTRILLLEDQASTDRRLIEQLEAKQREDRAHIETLERSLKAVKSEVQFVRQPDRVASTSSVVCAIKCATHNANNAFLLDLLLLETPCYTRRPPRLCHIHRGDPRRRDLL